MGTPDSGSAATNALFASLRREHSGALALLAELEAGLLERDPAGGAGRSLEAAVADLDGCLAAHVKVHDDVLFPALESAVPETSRSLSALRDEHDELRGLISALASRLREPRADSLDEQLRVIFRDLADLLRLHLDREERMVFTVASRVLRDYELTTLAMSIRQAIPSPSRCNSTPCTGKET